MNSHKVFVLLMTTNSDRNTFSVSWVFTEIYSDCQAVYPHNNFTL